MKKHLLAIIGLMAVAGLAHASDDFSYTATATPGSSPDGVDQNDSPVSVWTISQQPGVTGGGISGAYYGTAFSGETLSGWQIWALRAASPRVTAALSKPQTFLLVAV